jgi:hypothetical protein
MGNDRVFEEIIITFLAVISEGIRLYGSGIRGDGSAGSI